MFVGVGVGVGEVEGVGVGVNVAVAVAVGVGGGVDTGVNCPKNKCTATSDWPYCRAICPLFCHNAHATIFPLPLTPHLGHTF